MTNVVSFPDRVRGFAPARLIEARVALQASRDELGRAVGLTGQAIGYYETGARRPDMEKLLSIAAALRQPVTFFLREGRPMPATTGTRFFRSIGPKSNKLNASLDVKTKWLWEVVDRIGKLVRLPEVKLPSVDRSPGATSYSDEEIAQIATATRRLWGLGDGPIANVIALLETNGIIVSRYEMGSDKIDAFSCWVDGRPLILLGSDKESACRSRFDAAHEVGHIILHHGAAQEDLNDKRIRDRLEEEAHRFASEFLFPRNMFLIEFYSTRAAHLQGLKRRWGMSMQAIAHYAKVLGAIDDSQYVLFRKTVTKNRWLREEPLDREIPMEQPKMLLKAIKMLVDRGALPPSGLESENGFSFEMVQRLCGELPAALAPVGPSLTLLSS
ncbi:MULTISPECIES: helix-turn-helix domain-containing protein [Roseomonadaceae]|jgi:Zn-dependent peptidase ImmA (M78 family)/transcriptional regulator with XRE-family HTH domain|nr:MULTISPECIES: XRE family transcriptional regulator [Roseomonas]